MPRSRTQHSGAVVLAFRRWKRSQRAARIVMMMEWRVLPAATRSATWHGIPPVLVTLCAQLARLTIGAVGARVSCGSLDDLDRKVRCSGRLSRAAERASGAASLDIIPA
jgi:hypothetical protein